MRYSRAVFLASGLTFAAVKAAYGQAVWTYDHLANCPGPVAGKPRPAGCTVQTTLNVKPGDHFTIVITHTLASHFSYDIQGYAVAVDQKLGTTSGIRGLEAIDTVQLETTHDSRYGGYVISITPKGDVTGLPVGAATLVITVPQGKKPYAFSGGLSLTNVRNPGFEVRREFDTTATTPNLTVDTVNRIREDLSRRDAATVGFATFATVQLPRFGTEWPVFDVLDLAIGIGLETNGETQYYFGGGAELHDGIFLTSGYVLGRANTLPSGLRVGDRVTDANALANLGRHSVRGLFVGLSFTFLGGGQETFGKPFAGSAGSQ